jgi:CRP/FNR family transcriptional regulator, cyclic AMP receptor protein
MRIIPISGLLAGLRVERSAVIGLLEKTPFFGGLPALLLDKIAAKLRERRYQSGERLFGRGDDGARLFLVIEGRVRLSVVTEDGREIAFRQAGPGDVIGEIAVLDGGPRTADATALSAAHVMLLERSDIMALMRAEPEIGLSAVAFLCKRMRDTSAQLEMIALLSIEQRLARFLLAMSRDSTADAKGRVRISLGMSQTELALLLGASRPKVNLAIGSLEAQGQILRDGEAYLFRRARLAELAGAEEA